MGTETAGKRSEKIITADSDLRQMEAEALAATEAKGDLEFELLYAVSAGDEDRAATYRLAIQIMEDHPDQTAGFRPWSEPANLKKLNALKPQPPKFVMPAWLPCGYMTLFAGHGGVGKSMLALILAVCISMGLPFFGIPVERRRVMYLSCEDREDVLHWRLSRICAFLGISMADLDGWLFLLDLVGCDTILFRPSYDSSPLTESYNRLSVRMSASKSEVLFIDGISDTFNGNENSRAEVKAYVNSILALIPPDNGAVIMIGHVAKMAANTRTAEGYSGSTAWHNAARARWYLCPETSFSEDYGRPEKTGNLALELQKSNLGPADHSMTFSWNEAAGLFVGQETYGESNFDRKYREKQEQEGIMAALIACPDYVPAASSGQRTAYHVLCAQPSFPNSLRNGGAAKKRFWRLIEQLRAIGSIEEGTITRECDRKKVRILKPSKGLQHADNGENGIRSTLHAPPLAGMRAMPQGGIRGVYSQQTEFENIDLPLEVQE